MRLILAAELLLFVGLPAALGYALGLLLAALLGGSLIWPGVAALVGGWLGEIGLRRRCCRDSLGEWPEPVREVEEIW